jgi:dihydropteroate synthase
VPIVVGASRKAFIGAISGVKTAKDRLPGSLAAAVLAAAQGAQILRVHDVRETLEALNIWRATVDPENSGV